jgi:hypothetical protein
MPSVNLSPLFNGQTVFGSTSLPLAGGMIYTYQAGSSTPWATYTTANGTVANTNPIILGTDAKLPSELWLQAGFSYKFVVKDSDDVLVASYDDIAGILTQIPTTSPAVPSGCIIIWSGATGAIPSGFLICDGTNGTPDLRDKFVIGAGLSYSVGQTGGSKDAIVVSHTHTITDGGHTHTYGFSGNLFGGFPGVFAGDYVGGGSTAISTPTPQTASSFSGGLTINSATTNISVNTAGTSGTDANLPPYYALAFIMKS